MDLSVSDANSAAFLDQRRARKAIYRRTIDYNSSVINYLVNRVNGRHFTKSHFLQPDPLWSSKWTPEGRRLITGAYSGEFTLWNGLTFNFETILQAHESQIRCMKWSHNDEWLLTADHYGYVKYWQANMNNVEMYQAHKEPIRGVSFCPFDTKFVTCSDDSTVRIWDFQRCTEERVLRGHGSDVRSVAWHPVLSLIISGSKDAQQPIKLWDPKGGESITTLYVHKNTCTDVAWNANGNWFLTASRDHLIKLFDLRNLSTELQTFRGHKKDVMRVAWHPFQETVFASGSADGSIFYWAVGTDTELGAVDNAHESMIWSLAWHPLGHILVSGANDFATKFWTRNRPGDTSREALCGTTNEGLLTTGILGQTTVEADPLSDPNIALTSDILRQLSDANAVKIALETVDEEAFACNPDDLWANVEVPGLNDGPLATNLNYADSGCSGQEVEEKERSKLRSTRAIPKEFAANWASTRLTAMPIAMLGQAPPEQPSLEAAAAAVMSNAPPQYLPPVKPNPPPSTQASSQEVTPTSTTYYRSGGNQSTGTEQSEWIEMSKSDLSASETKPGPPHSGPPPDWHASNHRAHNNGELQQQHQSQFWPNGRPVPHMPPGTEPLDHFPRPVDPSIGPPPPNHQFRPRNQDQSIPPPPCSSDQGPQRFAAHPNGPMHGPRGDRFHPPEMDRFRPPHSGPVRNFRPNFIERFPPPRPDSEQCWRPDIRQPRPDFRDPRLPPMPRMRPPPPRFGPPFGKRPPFVDPHQQDHRPKFPRMERNPGRGGGPWR